MGEVYTEAPFVIEERTDWVKGSRVPDVLFYKAERFAAYTSQTQDWRDKPFALVPDLAIEVVSPNDRYTDINNKVNTYLSDGVQMVWIIDPQQRNAMVHRTGQTHIIQTNDTIDGADVLPGLQVRLNTLLGEE